jgi:uncharacterized protein (DUF488 family)
MTNIVYTVGHSTRSADEFVALLKAHGVTLLADVRTVRRSRHNPQFNGDALASTLDAYAIRYVPFPGLGGFRKTTPDSPNGGWRNLSFRGYADYMQTAAFTEHLDALIALARSATVAIMCAEAVPWRCHRSLIADALVVRGFDVREIASAAKTTPHELTPFAKVDGTTVRYPALALS